MRRLERLQRRYQRVLARPPPHEAPPGVPPEVPPEGPPPLRPPPIVPPPTIPPAPEGIPPEVPAGLELPAEIEAPPAIRRIGVLTRAQFFAVLIGAVIVIPAVLVGVFLLRPAELAIDGKFGDWSDETRYSASPMGVAGVAIAEYSVATLANDLFVYVQTAAPVMETTDVDSLYFFIDADGSAGTGYQIGTLGADYLGELHGWDGALQASSLMRFAPAASEIDQQNWSQWEPFGGVVPALGSDHLRLEARLLMGGALLSEASRVLILTDNGVGIRSSYSVGLAAGLLVAELLPPVSPSPPRAFTAAQNVEIGRVALTAYGTSGSVSVMPAALGSLTAGRLNTPSATLQDGVREELQILADLQGLPSGATIGVALAASGFSGAAFGSTAISGDPVYGYVGVLPSVVRIDGAFGEWTGATTDTDPQRVLNPNVNLTATGKASDPASASFYLRVSGELLAGTDLPVKKAKPAGDGGPPGPRLRATGEDIARVYLDTDPGMDTGSAVAADGGTLWADYKVEVLGRFGAITIKALYQWLGGAWSPQLATVTAALVGAELEFNISKAAVGSPASVEVAFEATDWRGVGDVSGVGAALSDPTLLGTDGALWWSPGTSSWATLPPLPSWGWGSWVDITTDINNNTYALFTTPAGNESDGRVYKLANGGSTWTPYLVAPQSSPGKPDTGFVAIANDTSQTLWTITTGQVGPPQKDPEFYRYTGTTGGTWSYLGAIDTVNPVFRDIVYSNGTGTSATLYIADETPNQRIWRAIGGGSTVAQVGNAPPASAAGGMTNAGIAVYGRTTIVLLLANGSMEKTTDTGTTWVWYPRSASMPGSNSALIWQDLAIDPAGNAWAITGRFVWRYTNIAAAYSSANWANYTGALSTTTLIGVMIPIPEFSNLLVPVAGTILIVALLRRRRMRRRPS